MTKKIDIAYVIFSVITVLMMFMYKYTGQTCHVAIGTLLCAVTIIQTLLTHRTWKNRADEVLLRLLLTLTFLSGFPVAKVKLPGIIIIHKLLSVFLAVYLVIWAIRKFSRNVKDM